MAPSFPLRPGPRAAVRSLLLLVVAATTAGACASGSSNAPAATAGAAQPSGPVSGVGGLTVDSASGRGAIGAGTAQSSNAEVATIEFVSTAVAGEDASGYLAPDPIDDPALGAPYTPAYLTPRLADLSGLVEGRPDVRPSTSAHPASPIGPACDNISGGAGSVCDVEVFDGSGRMRATVVVHWAGTGVTDFVIVDPSGTGAPGGVGLAVCSPGFTLLVGGHAVDRFDVAICTDARGAVEYQGASRENGDGITITACTAGRDLYEATNNGFGYRVKGVAGPQRGQLTVLNPSGATVLDTTFTPYRTTPAAPPDQC
ncbi:MAG: hypothetical protein OEY70_07995 [Acidimicrobiia bacterium]|nr:hypothetical protein [Acidimicrobiia bacterium]